MERQALTRLAVLGGGSWGTALAIVLAPRFSEIRIWVHDPALAREMAEARENRAYLPGFGLPENARVLADVAMALDGAEVVLGVMPSHVAREVYRSAAPFMPRRAFVVSATKGIENGTLLRMSEVIRETLDAGVGVGVLSGPSFAREVASGQPAAVVIAAEEAEVATAIQAAFAGPTFRLYTNGDVTGVEIGAALKNVIAIAAGVCEGLGLGNSTVAALITRGLAELTRLAVAMGGKAKTLAGLAGLGDLVLTCNGALSRNRQVGIALGRGESIAEITGRMRMVAEGVPTAYAAMDLARREGVELPICEQMERILRGYVGPKEAIRELMERSLKEE